MWQRLYCSSTVWVLYYLYWKLYFNMTDGSIRVIPPNELLRVHPPKIENFIIFWPNNLDILFSKRWKLCFSGSKNSKMIQFDIFWTSFKSKLSKFDEIFAFHFTAILFSQIFCDSTILEWMDIYFFISVWKRNTKLFLYIFIFLL